LWLGGAGAAVAFLLLALHPSDGAAALFAAVFLALAAGACCGPFLSLRQAAAFTVAAVLSCVVVALARGGATTNAIGCGLFAGLFAGTAGATAGAIRIGIVRPLLCVAGLALLTTFFYWDEAFLFAAADRKASASLAFDLNPAAAASVTIGFDWMHAKALYTDNQTAESMFGVPVSGAGLYALKVLGLFIPATAIAVWRERRAA
jgi:hypothetical protein